MKPIDPKDSYAYLIATSNARRAQSMAYDFSAVAANIDGDERGHQFYLSLKHGYLDMANYYLRAAAAAPDAPKDPVPGLNPLDVFDEIATKTMPFGDEVAATDHYETARRQIARLAMEAALAASEGSPLASAVKPFEVAP